jgi:hypothetical protein
VEKEPTQRSSVATLARTLRLAALIVGVMIVALGLWAWLSAGSDSKLPFGYGGFG